MPELRKDPIVGRWVIVAPERASRPSALRSSADRVVVEEDCPFCPGHEDETPPEVMTARDDGGGPDTPGWQVRVVPNRYPALRIEGDLEKRGFGLYDRMNGIGAHEVVIDTPDHTLSVADFDEGHMERVLDVCRARMKDLKNDPRFLYIQLFKNQGRSAGATQTHSHWQIISTPIVPIHIAEEVRGAEKHYRQRDRCVFCDLLSQEEGEGTRMVARTEHHAAFVPFAARFPYEVWILPRKHDAAFEERSLGDYGDLARLIRELVARIRVTLGDPAYNLVLRTAPVGSERVPHYHWHIEIIPRLTRVAGFEWGTGFYINPMAPEDAAAQLRGGS